MGLAGPLQGMQVVAQAVQGDPAGEQAAERLLAREGPSVPLEVGLLQFDRRGVLGGGVEAELDPARDRASQQRAPDVLESGAALRDVQRGFELRDLLAHDVDAVQIEHAVDLEVLAVEEPWT